MAFQINSQRHFYGWWIVAAAAAGLAVHFGPIVVGTFGVFLLALEGEFGFSRSELSGAIALALLGVTVAQPRMGRIIDRFGPRQVIMVSGLLMSAVFASLFLLTSALWHLYLIFFLLGCLSAGCNPVPYAKVVSNWFDQRRGIALALAIAGSSLGVSLMAPLANWLISDYGWRIAYALLGVIVVAVMLPTAALILRDSPETMGVSPDGSSPRNTSAAVTTYGFSVRQALRMHNFWALMVVFFVISIAFHACVIHLVPMLTDAGMTVEEAAGLAALLGVGILLGRVVTGILLDRFFAAPVAAAVFLLFMLAILLLRMGGSAWTSYLAVALLGLAQGAEFDLMAYMVSRYFGLSSFGEIYGYVFAAFNLGGMMGAPLMGMGYDLTGAYTTGLSVLAVMPAIAIAIVLRLGPYPVDFDAAAPVRFKVG